MWALLVSGMLHTTVTEENVLFNLSILSRAVSGLSGGPERVELIWSLIVERCVLKGHSLATQTKYCGRRRKEENLSYLSDTIHMATMSREVIVCAFSA